jgi:hypothetical protein
MTGAAHIRLDWPSREATRARQLALTVATWLIAVNILIGAPLFALWVGSRTQPSGTASMGSIVIVVVVLAAVSYGLVALLRSLAQAQGDFEVIVGDNTRQPWLYGKPRARRRSHARQARPRAVAAAPAEAPREPLVLIDGGTGASRPWRSVTPHLEFGFDVLAGVLPRDGSLDGTVRAMDRVGWQTAHVVARPCDARAAVDLARLGRARSLLILGEDSVDAVAVATEIAEFAVFRSAA